MNDMMILNEYVVEELKKRAGVTNVEIIQYSSDETFIWCGVYIYVSICFKFRNLSAPITVSLVDHYRVVVDNNYHCNNGEYSWCDYQYNIADQNFAEKLVQLILDHFCQLLINKRYGSLNEIPIPQKKKRLSHENT